MQAKSGRQSVLIVGTGAFAQGLASLAIRSGATASYDIALGSRRGSGVLPGLEETPVRTLDDALPQADLVILAVPAASLPSFAQNYSGALSNKVVIDVTNPWQGDYAKLAACTFAPNLTCDIDDVERSKDVDSARNSSKCPSLSDSARTRDQGEGDNKGSWRSKASDYLPKVSLPSYTTNKASAAGTSTATWFAGVLPSSATVVKAFNNLSAYTLLHGDPLTEHMKSVAASDDWEAAETAASFGRAMGLEMRIVPSLSYARSLEARQHSLLPTWQWPTWLMFWTWLVVHIYSFIRYNYYGGAAWQSVILWILNKSVGWVSLWGMVFTYLPGVVVCYMQLFTRRPAVRLPRWLKAWMDGRKQLGLLSLFTMLLHLLFSTFLWMPSYYSKLWDNTDVAVVPALNGTKLDKFGLMKTSNLPKFPTGMQVVFGDELLHYQTANGTVLSTWPVQGPRHPAGAAGELTATHPAEVLTTAVNIITLRSKLNWIGESSTLVGIIAGVLMAVIALTSMPSITPKMNWREWRLLQSHAGWLAVFAATVHVLLLGAPWWSAAAEDWPKMIPTITLMSTIPPMLLLVLKGALVLPPISCLLSGVRSGKLARKVGGDPLAHLAVFAVKQH